MSLHAHAPRRSRTPEIRLAIGLLVAVIGAVSIVALIGRYPAWMLAYSAFMVVLVVRYALRTYHQETGTRADTGAET